MENKTYSEKLKDPRWQKKRLEILERDDWKCMACGTKDNTLHVHHIFYFPKKEPWEIENGFLITFCEDCHNPACDLGPCDKCDHHILDLNNEMRCEGICSPSVDLLSCLGSLLNEIWKNDKVGNFYSTVGHIAQNIGGKNE